MLKIKNINIINLLLLVFLLSGCNGFFEKDNTPPPSPLTQYRSEVTPIQLWSTRTGSGAGNEYLKMSPGRSPNAIFTASTNGTVTSVNKKNGAINWQITTGIPLTAGPGVGDGVVVVASRKGDVLALHEEDGSHLWRTHIPGEILAQPAVSNDIVILKTIDGDIRALSLQTGQEVWANQEPEPTLILRGSSSPLILNGNVFVGYANGTLSKYSLWSGQPFWTQTIAVPEGAFAIQRMIDIDADPLVHNHHVYAATYQGKIASLDWLSGKILWAHDISSYTGMIADDETLFISDAKGHVWAFNTHTGFVNWRQNKLEDRGISGPASMYRYVVVGDSEGYLHWLDKFDGHFAARTHLGSHIYASPFVENDILYAFSSNGDLAAYTLKL